MNQIEHILTTYSVTQLFFENKFTRWEVQNGLVRLLLGTELI